MSKACRDAVSGAFIAWFGISPRAAEILKAMFEDGIAVFTEKLEINAARFQVFDLRRAMKPGSLPNRH